MSHSMTEPTGSAASGSPAPADASVGDLIKVMSADLSRLVRDEIQLAQTEISAKVKQAGVGVGAFGGAGVLALYGGAALIAAAVLGLALVLPAWLAALIVGVVVLAIAGVIALIGKKKVSEAGPAVPERTVASVKQDVAEIKESIRND
jgi:Putative Actinobacterial Holin-X, holin superfamily III